MLSASILTVPEVDRFIRKARIGDSALVGVVERAERGIVDADLGGGLVKLRVGRPNEDRRNGFRTIVAFRAGERAFFLAAYGKNELSAVGERTERDLRAKGRALQALSDGEIDELKVAGHLREVERS